MRALYVTWPDFEYIDKAIAAGIDTLIIANQNLPTDPNPLVDNGYGGTWGMWDDCKRVIERYQGSGVRLLFSPLMVKHWDDLPKDQQLFDGTNYWTRTPCPTSTQFITDRVKPVADIANQYNIELVWDIENYADTRCIYKTSKRKRHKCRCDRCKDISVNEQYKIHKDNIRAFIVTRGVGSYPYDAMWVLDLFGDKAKYFTEYTYSSSSSLKNKLWVLWLKLFGVKTVAGIWMEKYDAGAVLKKIEDMEKSWMYNGYWLYPHARMSRNSPMLAPYKDPNIDPYFNTLIDEEDPQFFEKLKKIND